ncbi:MAG: DUF3794 domain-containing protein [Anaerovoracaceae bacterium]
MTYENEIPDYALQPAKEPEAEVLETTIEKIPEPVVSIEALNAVYSPIKITNSPDIKASVVEIEEDVLVPDIKMDMREILMMDGTVRLSSLENGEINLQTVYIPEGENSEGEIISIKTKIPFKTQWQTVGGEKDEVILEGSIGAIEYMIINERKFRVKIVVNILGRQYGNTQIDVFEKLVDESIETLKEKIEITDMALRKKDIISIDEELQIKDTVGKPEQIIKENITLIENYKQITGDKIVVNGFVYCNLLYFGEELLEDEENKEIFQFQGRTEFTQFIPINQSGPWSGSKVVFKDMGLTTSIGEDEGGRPVFKINGDIETSVELYKNIEKEMIVDGYHKEKEFCCDFEQIRCNTLVGNGFSDTSIREIINIPAHAEGFEKVVYCFGNIKKSDTHMEQGKCIVEGQLEGKLICQGHGEKPNLFTLTEAIPFRCTTEMPLAKGDEKVSKKIYIKDFWADKINGKQIEFNCTISVFAEIMKDTNIKILKGPGFKIKEREEKCVAMAVSIVQENDTLWSIAKRFKTTVDNIKDVNSVDDDLEAGTKILIVK